MPIRVWFVGLETFISLAPSEFEISASIQAHAIEGVPGGHVRQDDPVALVESFQNLHRVDRAAAQLYLDPLRGASSGLQPEQADLALLAAEGRPAHRKN